MQLTAHDLIFSMTAAISTAEQDEAVEEVADLLAEQGEAATHADWLPDERYAAVEAACELIPGYDALANHVAEDNGKNPADGGLDCDPLTQTLHDIYSEAQDAALREMGDDAPVF